MKHHKNIDEKDSTPIDLAAIFDEEDGDENDPLYEWVKELGDPVMDRANGTADPYISYAQVLDLDSLEQVWPTQEDTQGHNIDFEDLTLTPTQSQGEKDNSTDSFDEGVNGDEVGGNEVGGEDSCHGSRLGHHPAS
ncbi:hypothetical protein FRX31_017161 [Thalictrum thalictroides]|uniref:Uncharacterized protein n=1 Tax=Thalictrum thalictroides TaxID=46969 RepID=A0A7J6W8U5_THATH|nr:hypothetical protein FRX31_017161 [Thalictrum thalictroides]